jgi:excisionase family DNA binding protein
MPDQNLITETTALISGPAAYLLAKLLKSPPVTTYIRGAGWLHGPDFEQAIRAINAASDAWQTHLDLGRRQTADARVQSPHSCDTMTIEQASETLQLSRRHTQRLAQEGVITGRRVGRRWELDARSVTAYQHRQQQRTAA